MNFVSEKGGTPLVNSLLCPNKKIFLLLLKNNADINLTTKNGYSPLIISCVQNNYSLADYLIKQGANVNQKTLEGWAAILYASGNAPFSYDQITSKLNRDLVQALHKQTNYNIKYNPTDSVDLLLKSGANPNESNVFGTTPLMLASEIENCETVELLLNNRAKTDQLDNDGRNALMYAVRSSVDTFYDFLTNLKLLHLEVSFNADTSKELKRDFQAIFMQNQNQTTRFLVEHGCNLHCVDKNGLTTLMHAVHSGNLQVVKFLVDSGMDIEQSTSEKFTLLHFAALSGNNDIINYFLENGMDVDIKMVDGETPLLTAVWTGNVSTVDLLIKKGANVNALKKTPYNPEGESALQWAAHQFQSEKDAKFATIFELLFNAGAKTK